jgi:di/tricarboxylate transporter
MTLDQALVFAILGGALIAFAWGRWRYDLVAVAALLLAVLTGVVEADSAFLGFGHPAVVTVVAVLVVGRGLERSGLVGVVSRRLLALGHRPLAQLAILSGLVMIASSIINNVGALALFLPVALRVSRETGRAPSLILMPLAFASLLGGLTTLIGTPPNIIIATFRREASGDGFGMFDFAPVGASVALTGFLFMILVGWRLVPARRGGIAPGDLFDVGRYLTELRVPPGSPASGATVGAVVSGADVVAVSLIRADEHLVDIPMLLVLESGDVLIVEGDPGVIDTLIADHGLTIGDGAGVAGLELFEAVVVPGAFAVGRDVVQLRLRGRHGVNLLGIARAGRRLHERLARARFEAGDVVLLQGEESAVRAAMADLGLLPLAPRELSLGTPRRLALGTLIFGGAVAVTVAGLVPVQISFAVAAAAMIGTRLLSLEQAYKAVDLPVVVLLGAMLPVGEALATTGGAEIIAGRIAALDGLVGPGILVAVLLCLVMLLSNVVNNAAAAVIAAPIALQLASALEVSADTMLMAVAVGASLPLLTPIGHQSNLLVMAPGGYRFADYWRLGLPMSLLVVAVGTGMILWVWPLTAT